LILGRAAPEWSSKKRDLLICTGGVTENFEWRRLYPILIQDISKIHGFSWVDVRITREGLADPRPESRKVVRECGSYLTEIGRVEDEGVRKWYVESLVRDCVEVMKAKHETMGIVKPIIESVEIDEVEPAPTDDEKQTTLSLWASHPYFNKQATIEKWKREYAKKDFEVRFKFKCGSKCQLDHHNMKVLDIEFFMLYRHVFTKYQDIAVTFQKMKEKLEKELADKDFYFTLGTHSSYPFLSYMIGSVIRIKKGVKAIKPLKVR
jgi:hypothetical protein